MNRLEGTLRKLAGRYKAGRKHGTPPDRVLLTCGCGWQKAVDVRFWESELLKHVSKFHEGGVAMPSFSGESTNGAPIIGAGYWKKGKQISGAITGVFPTQVGQCYNLSLMDEIEVEGEHLSPPQKGKVKGTEWSIGALKGLDMAIRASGCGGLQVRDLIILTCTGSEKTNKGNDRVNFKLQVTRK